MKLRFKNQVVSKYIHFESHYNVMKSVAFRRHSSGDGAYYVHGYIAFPVFRMKTVLNLLRRVGGR